MTLTCVNSLMRLSQHHSHDEATYIAQGMRPTERIKAPRLDIDANW